eukprot:CAMPEP_0198492402 /NCGR_PEP_ID=MMETSP1462-20131121/3407_1 /TAXON_ID=1333877 /ORGANISM="Brandtodinium nutriculum, Strain RCC3387" /LENGTH=197 /DNA_ID=CAMNT_0044221045 /DNA_START=58 /DNA_END=648 /DNA_ORIENTATION=-
MCRASAFVRVALALSALVGATLLLAGCDRAPEFTYWKFVIGKDPNLFTWAVEHDAGGDVVRAMLMVPIVAHGHHEVVCRSMGMKGSDCPDFVAELFPREDVAKCSCTTNGLFAVAKFHGSKSDAKHVAEGGPLKLMNKGKFRQFKGNVKKEHESAQFFGAKFTGKTYTKYVEPLMGPGVVAGPRVVAAELTGKSKRV